MDQCDIIMQKTDSPLLGAIQHIRPGSTCQSVTLATRSSILIMFLETVARSPVHGVRCRPSQSMGRLYNPGHDKHPQRCTQRQRFSVHDRPPGEYGHPPARNLPPQCSVLRVPLMIRFRGLVNQPGGKNLAERGHKGNHGHATSGPVTCNNPYGQHKSQRSVPHGRTTNHDSPSGFRPQRGTYPPHQNLGSSLRSRSNQD
jgi:hypothetical protein